MIPGRGDLAYTRGGLLPTPVFERSRKAYPMLRYPWADARAALLALSEDRPDQEAVQITYANPETGAHAENILGFYALMLRPGQTLKLPVRSPAVVFHVIEGDAQVAVDDQRFSLAEADTCCAPGYTPVTLRNASASVPAFILWPTRHRCTRSWGCMRCVLETRCRVVRRASRRALPGSGPRYDGLRCAAALALTAS